MLFKNPFVLVVFVHVIDTLMGNNMVCVCVCVLTYLVVFIQTTLFGCRYFKLSLCLLYLPNKYLKLALFYLAQLF
jgi:hypothetical protein